MEKFNLSGKYVAINKSNAQMVVVVAIASFITIFCLVATKAVHSQYQYQAHVISVANTADQQLKDNITTYKKLVVQYVKFNAKNPNILGANVQGKLNDNAQVVLDALPGKYDYPALITSIENILSHDGLQIASLDGTDLGSESQSNTAKASPVTMPFSFSVSNANYTSTQALVQSLQQSIRPLVLDTLSVSASPTGLTVSATGHSYYQPASTLGITSETVQ